MKLVKRTALASAIVGAIGIGGAGQVSASIYAGSHLFIQDMAIKTFAATPQPSGSTLYTPIYPSSFNFSMTNTASLNGSAVIDTSACSGIFNPTTSTASCGGGGSGARTVLGGSSDIATGTGAGPNAVKIGSIAPGEDNYSFFGPGANQYGRADSVIYDAALVNDAATKAEMVSEAELQNGTDASGGSTLQSVTKFTYSFILPTTGLITIDFKADPDLLAWISDPIASAATAQADISARFQLQDDTGTTFVTWSPQGTAANDCLAFGATCIENADGEDLNRTVGSSTLPASSDPYSWDAPLNLSNFSLTAAGLNAGKYTFTLFAQTQANVTRVPEPGMLALLGAGLAALGVTGGRRRKSGVTAA